MLKRRLLLPFFQTQNTDAAVVECLQYDVEVTHGGRYHDTIEIFIPSEGLAFNQHKIFQSKLKPGASPSNSSSEKKIDKIALPKTLIDMIKACHQLSTQLISSDASLLSNAEFMGLPGTQDSKNSSATADSAVSEKAIPCHFRETSILHNGKFENVPEYFIPSVNLAFNKYDIRSSKEIESPSHSYLSLPNKTQTPILLSEELVKLIEATFKARENKLTTARQALLSNPVYKNLFETAEPTKKITFSKRR